ncbi:MAG: TrmH family RNA methyltransferase [Patescibacteria group bacterium]|jgi:tRNA G18 (ribose-2'-O)-methylase SpoU
MIIIAHDIRSLYNVGSIFRNAAAFGVEKVYLTGYTAVPPRKEIAKVALGGEQLVDWEAGVIEVVIDELRGRGYQIFGLETGEKTIPIEQAPRVPIALVLGNEVTGIPKEIQEKLDGLLEIPMEKKRSLNVSVASGVAMFILQERS